MIYMLLQSKVNGKQGLCFWARTCTLQHHVLILNFKTLVAFKGIQDFPQILSSFCNQGFPFSFWQPLTLKIVSTPQLLQQAWNRRTSLNVVIKDHLQDSLPFQHFDSPGDLRTVFALISILSHSRYHFHGYKSPSDYQNNYMSWTKTTCRWTFDEWRNLRKLTRQSSEWRMTWITILISNE